MTHGATFFSAVAGAPWDDVAPLARVLGVMLAAEPATLTAAHSRALWKKLSYLGSSNLAYLLRGFEGVDYPEIVRDVCRHLNAAELQPGDDERSVEHNEQLVLAQVFAAGWEHLDADQRGELLRELNLDEAHRQLAGAEVASAVLAGRGGSFALYKLSRIVANSVDRALPARRLGAARRKTVQAVALVASLRQAQRTALAETALASAGVPADSLGAAAAPPNDSQRQARKKTARRPRQAQPGAKKKASPARAAAQRGRKEAGPPRAPGKKSAAKKTAAKKKAAKKVAKKKAKRR